MEHLTILGHLAVVVELDTISLEVGLVLRPSRLSTTDRWYRKLLLGSAVTHASADSLESLHDSAVW